jgi:hypothetical protein
MFASGQFEFETRHEQHLPGLEFARGACDRVAVASRVPLRQFKRRELGHFKGALT